MTYKKNRTLLLNDAIKANNSKIFLKLLRNKTQDIVHIEPIEWYDYFHNLFNITSHTNCEKNVFDLQYLQPVETNEILDSPFEVSELQNIVNNLNKTNHLG